MAAGEEFTWPNGSVVRFVEPNKLGRNEAGAGETVEAIGFNKLACCGNNPEAPEF